MTDVTGPGNTGNLPKSHTFTFNNRVCHLSPWLSVAPKLVPDESVWRNKNYFARERHSTAEPTSFLRVRIASREAWLSGKAGCFVLRAEQLYLSSLQSTLRCTQRTQEGVSTRTSFRGHGNQSLDSASWIVAFRSSFHDVNGHWYCLTAKNVLSFVPA